MAELQLARLRRVLKRAGQEVPYYRDLFAKSGFDPSHLTDMREYERVPVSTKADLQDLPPQKALSHRVDPQRLIVRKTTGSTGRPFTILRTWSEERMLGAYRRRALMSYGLTLRDTHVDLVEINSRDPNDDGRMHELLMRLGLFRQHRIDATLQPAAIVERLKVLRPDVLTGYAASVALTAQWLLERDSHMQRLRFVAVHSEVLTALMRSQIERAFRCPVYVLYDCNECNLVASECPQTGHLHICDDSVLVEVVRDGKPVASGEEGEVLITSLHSFAHPVIRFQMGDLATRGAPQCSCGAPFSTLRRVHGRMLDIFPLSDGRMLHPYRITALLGDHASWIRQYELVQERVDLIRLRVVSAGPVDETELAHTQARVDRELQGAATFTIDFVNELETQGRAKFRVWRSLVASKYRRPSSAELP